MAATGSISWIPQRVSPMMGARGHVRFFCAICAGDIPSDVPKQSPIGKNKTMVNVCDGCHDEPAREIQGPVLGYRPSDGMSMATMTRKMSGFAERNHIPHIRRNETMNNPTPGWIVVRVPRRDASGRARDMREALDTLRHKPWARRLRFLGFDSSRVLFERPPNARYTPIGNPLSAIERYRVRSMRCGVGPTRTPAPDVHHFMVHLPRRGEPTSLVPKK